LCDRAPAAVPAAVAHEGLRSRSRRARPGI
jgi:hypothetical protein